jgi:methionyl aminopeptidase
MSITFKTPEQIDNMRIAGKLASEVLDFITPYVKAGVTTNEINDLCHHYIINTQHAIPAPLNYNPSGNLAYPKSICTSLNEIVCHGIPNDKPLKNGDCINIDVTVIKNGFYGDTSRMFTVGIVAPHAIRLIKTTFEAMWLGIKQVKPGNYLGDIGYSIQRHCELAGFSVVREFCGHGIGQRFHEEPQVLHYGHPKQGVILKAGMIFTIEPMINAGKKEIKMMPDGWGARTKDRTLSAQWEHTVLVTDTGYEVLTVSEGTPACPS